MKVKNLIHQLSKMDPEYEVIAASCNHDYPILECFTSSKRDLEAFGDYRCAERYFAQHPEENRIVLIWIDD